MRIRMYCATHTFNGECAPVLDLGPMLFNESSVSVSYELDAKELVCTGEGLTEVEGRINEGKNRYHRVFVEVTCNGNHYVFQMY